MPREKSSAQSFVKELVELCKTHDQKHMSVNTDMKMCMGTEEKYDPMINNELTSVNDGLQNKSNKNKDVNSTIKYKTGKCT